jgi:hypothetical protein
MRRYGMKSDAGNEAVHDAVCAWDDRRGPVRPPHEEGALAGICADVFEQGHGTRPAALERGDAQPDGFCEVYDETVRNAILGELRRRANQFRRQIAQGMYRTEVVG